MYFVFKHDIMAWRNQTLKAHIQGECPSPEYQTRWWDLEPLSPPPAFTFAVNARAPRLDNYFTGTLVDLYSVRLVTYLQEAAVKLGSFPATIVDHKTQQTLPDRYAVFHLQEIHPGLDETRSEIDRFELKRLALTEECMQAKRPLFRLEESRNIVVIHEELLRILNAAGITGCSYTPVDEFRIGFGLR